MSIYALNSSSVEETEAIGASLAAFLQAGDVLVLVGDLGAGKTHFSKGIAQGLDIQDEITSPTFNLLLVYEGRLPLYHFDLYRLEDAEELIDIDYAATLEADGVSLVEWGDRFPDEMPVDYLLVKLLHCSGDANKRLLCFESFGNQSQAALDSWMKATEGSYAFQEYLPEKNR